MSASEQLEQRTREIGREILQRIEAARPPDFTERLRRDPLSAWARRGNGFLAEALRFIDIYPALSDDEELLRYLRAYLSDPDALLGAPPTPPAVRALVRSLQERFIAGDTLEDALAVCRRLHERGMTATLDILGEAVISEREAEQYLARYLDLFPRAAAVMAAWPPHPLVDRAAWGAVPRLNVSIKLSSLYHRFDAIDPRGAFEAVAPRLREIFRAARDAGALVNVDMEQYAFKSLTLDIFKRVLTEEEFRAWPNVSITLQSYLVENRRDLPEMMEWVRRRGTPIAMRVAKGAYWDHETQLAGYQNWPPPVHLSKGQTDAAFEEAVRIVLNHPDLIRPAIAAHNVRSIAHAVAVAEAKGLATDFVEYQTLLGLGDELRNVLTDMGCRMRVYVPWGGLVPGMAYLVRRLLEATSRSAFLRQMWAAPLPVDSLLAMPEGDTAKPTAALAELEFRNEPLSDFAQPSCRDAMAQALEAVRGRLGERIPLRLDGRNVKTRGEIVRENPGNISQIVGRVAAASRAQAGRAVAVAQETLRGWSRLSAKERAAYLRAAAQRMRERRFELAAWEVFETAKPWREADGDVAEAMDYLEFYAYEAERFAAPRRRPAPGERNEYFYEPRGVAVVIAPWNFPLAILCGMTAAAAVTGNTVLMKPAEQSSVTAARFMEIWREAGLPEGVIQLLPGRGEEIGAFLVRHPDVHVVAFTGSLEVGLRIRREAATPRRGQRHLKQIIAELGGKNAMIIDRDADLDQAVPGVLHSAFGYAGQKCSACSRAIVHRDIHDLFLERLVEAARGLPVGPVEAPHNVLGPLIDAEAFARVSRTIEAGRTVATVALEADVSALNSEGYYVGPVIFSDVDPQSSLAQEEIFGPVLSVMRADSLDTAFAMANDVKYGLTAGIYSRHPGVIERARHELLAGNVYVNRGITGARVDRQPFGGWKLSGIGTKAGGPDYLTQFLQPKTFTENTLRRGFAPPELSAESKINPTHTYS